MIAFAIALRTGAGRAALLAMACIAACVSSLSLRFTPHCFLARLSVQPNSFAIFL
jgi:hypothetical protein